MTELHLLTTAEVPPAVLAEIRALCERTFDSFPPEDWEHGLGGLHAVALDGGDVVAHACVVPRSLEVAGVAYRSGFVENVVADPSRHGAGLGSLVMTRITGIVRERYEFGALATGRHTFYERLGWERWQGPTYARTAAGLLRTEEDDDAIMVLRSGATEGIDLTAAISCEERPGDDW